MNLIRLIKIEIGKLKRSKIGLILLIPVLLVWISGIMNADMNFEMQAEGISPENNFFIQSFLGYVWFMLPSSLVVITVLMTQTERGNNGILKMLSLPVSGAAPPLRKVRVFPLQASDIQDPDLPVSEGADGPASNLCRL